MTGGTTPWMSPELLDPERFGLKKSRLTKESDRYALGMVVYEILSGRTPFAPHTEAVVMLKVLAGERPERPQGSRRAWFGDGIWAMLDLCWKPQPHERPSLDTILQRLQGASRPPGPIPPIEDETNADGQADPAIVTDTSMFSPFGPIFHTHPIVHAAFKCCRLNIIRCCTVRFPDQLRPQGPAANCSQAAIGPPNARGENGIQAPRPSPLPGVTGPTDPQSGNQLSDQQKVGDPQKGWIGSRLARKVSKAVVEWVEGL